MFSKESQSTQKTTPMPETLAPSGSEAANGKRTTRSRRVTEARATAQRAKLDAQAETRQRQTEQAQKERKTKSSRKNQDQQDVLAQRRANTPIRRAIDDYLLDHTGGNHSNKTLEWHQTALDIIFSFFEEEHSITLIGEIDAPDITACFAHLRTSPGKRGKSFEALFCSLFHLIYNIVAQPVGNTNRYHYNFSSRLVSSSLSAFWTMTFQLYCSILRIG